MSKSKATKDSTGHPPKLGPKCLYLKQCHFGTILQKMYRQPPAWLAALTFSEVIKTQHKTPAFSSAAATAQRQMQLR